MWHSVYGKKLTDVLRERIASISMVSSPTINKKEAYFSKTLAHFWQSAWYHIPKDSILRVTPFRNSNVTLLMQSLGQYWRYLKHRIRSTIPIEMLCVCSINHVQSGHIQYVYYLHKSNVSKCLFGTISYYYCRKHNWWTHSKYYGVAYRDLVLWSSTVPQKWCLAVSGILLTFIHLHHWISRLVTSNCLRSCNKICVLSRAMIEFHSSLTGNISFFVGCEKPS